MEHRVIPDRTIDQRKSVEDAGERMSSGNAEADYILGGGFPANSINIVMGHPGSGKTIFAEQLIFHNADADRPILYFTTLSEPLAKVVRYLQGTKHVAFATVNEHARPRRPLWLLNIELPHVAA